jgi:PilZ domain
MFQHWTFSHPAPQTEGRAERHSVDLKVAITISFESWQLLWPLRTLNISTSGILCAVNVTDQLSAQRTTDLDALLDAEPEVQLQIDATNDDLFAPSLTARLVRKTKKPWGLELAFQFSEDNDDLESLVGSLRYATPRPTQTQH